MTTFSLLSKRISILAALALLAGLPAHASIDYEEEGLMDYESIIKELSHPPAQNNSLKTSQAERDPFADVMIHGGVGLATTMADIKVEGKTLRMNQPGFQAALGIDLFSKHWMAEGTARTFSGTNYEHTNLALKEFDLKLYYRDRLTPKLGVRVGGGISARYLNITTPDAQRIEYTTPASIGALGFDYYFSRSVSLGAELSARNTLIDETIDKNSVDGVVRIDTHF